MPCCGDGRRRSSVLREAAYVFQLKFDNHRHENDGNRFEDHGAVLQRLADFSRRFFPDRPLKIGLVGHSFIIDALLTYIANNKNISSEGFDKIGGDVVQETELSTIEFDEGNNLVLNYRGKKFPQKSSDERSQNR